MKKYDSLFKKVELFEKLAVYSDRSKFLIAISKIENNSEIDHMTGAQLEKGTNPKKQLINNLGYVINKPSEIKMLQMQLKNNGMNLAVDGVWGPESYQAMCEFQSKNNLPVTGTISESTYKLLDRRKYLL